jgi:hypothetical protein
MKKHTTVSQCSVAPVGITGRENKTVSPSGLTIPRVLRVKTIAEEVHFTFMERIG